MSLRAGIVGLPNVGKSTLFSALTAAPVERARYPFTTIDPNVGVVTVPDERLEMLASFFPDREVIPAVVQIVDIAGLIRGASQGEGLGNEFLSHIRGVDAIVHVVRCFEDPDVASITGRLDPDEEIETIATELMLADLQVIERRRLRAERARKTGDRDAGRQLAILEAIESTLAGGDPVRSHSHDAEAADVIREAQLLTAKPVLYVCNVSEEGLAASRLVDRVREAARKEEAPVVVICAQLEAEIAELPSDEQEPFRAAAGLREPGTAAVARQTYRLLGLISFFTTPTQVRAWQLIRGKTALDAAGEIHSDFAAHFVKAEVYRVEDLAEHGSEAALRSAGLMRTEGRDYVVADGDVLAFRVSP